MLIFCLLFTSTAVVFTYFYRFDLPLSYAELANYIQKGKDQSEENEKGTTERLL